jgi:hypothetical protein
MGGPKSYGSGSATLLETVKILTLCLEIVPHPVQKLLARKLLPFLPKQEKKTVYKMRKILSLCTNFLIKTKTSTKLQSKLTTTI